MCFAAAVAWMELVTRLKEYPTGTSAVGVRRDPANLTEERIDFRTPSGPGRLSHQSFYSSVHLSKGAIHPSIHLSIYLSIAFLWLSTSIPFQGFSPGDLKAHQKDKLSVGVTNGASNCLRW